MSFVDMVNTDDGRRQMIEIGLKFGFSKSMVIDEIRNFVLYWTEKSPGGKKMRFQKEKVFDPKRRLYTWFRNKVKWGASPQTGRGEAVIGKSIEI